MVQSNPDKEAFFQGLERLDALLDDSGDEADEGFSQIIALANDYVEPVHQVDPAPSDSPVQKTGALGATSALQSPSLDVTDHGKCGNTSIVVIEEVQALSVEESIIMGASKKKVDGKKKRTSTTKTVAEQHQIFKGLVFC